MIMEDERGTFVQRAGRLRHTIVDSLYMAEKPTAMRFSRMQTKANQWP